MRGEVAQARAATSPERAAASSKRPGDLAPGDVVVFGGAAFEVLSEPFLGMSGTSVFDAPALFWRARVGVPGGDRRAKGYATWAVDEDVTVL
jgi:hypothetical protein